MGQHAAALLVDKESVDPEVEQLAVGAVEILRPGHQFYQQILVY